MPVQHNDEPLDLDRELTALLSVEPSVEFLARVRMRISSEPPPSLWRPVWVAVSVCAMLAVMVGGALQISQTGLSSSRLLADLSFLVPAIVPGPLVGVSGQRREKPSPELQAIMRSNATATEAVAAHLAERNYGALVDDAEAFSGNFAAIEQFWTSRDESDAVGLSRTGLRAAADLHAAAVAGDDAAIARALAAMTAVCAACHLQYREELPDRTYAIKL